MNEIAGSVVPQQQTFNRAPEPTVDRIEELASRILSGDILLPKFQRDFVWERSQILDLLDSISNNYPVGSVLLWRSRQELKSERNIADLDIAPTKQDYPVNYLLDGQQRLSTICGALYWRGTDPRSRWNVAYDVREKRFLHLETLDPPALHHIRLNRIPDAANFFQQVATLEREPDGDKLAASAKELFNRFKDYKIATVTLHDMSIEAVAPIFERINSKGTPLTIVDLMRAATWSEDFDLVDEIQTIVDELNQKNFGGIERKTVLRSISAAAGGGFSESSIDQLRKHNAPALRDAVDATRLAYQRAVDFLATDIHIPSDRQLPYVNQMVVLGEIFRTIKAPTGGQTEEIRKWFWRTAISGYFGGWNTGNMATDQTAARAFVRGYHEIEAPVAPPSPAIWRQREFRSNSAHSKILILILAFQRPRDLLTGAFIDVGSALYHGNSKEYHHFFPQDYLKNRGIAVRRANSLANFVFLSAASNKTITNRAPSNYLTQVEKHLGIEINQVLESNLISPAAYDAAMADDFESFLELRSESIQTKALELARW